MSAKEKTMLKFVLNFGATCYNRGMEAGIESFGKELLTVDELSEKNWKAIKSILSEKTNELDDNSNIIRILARGE